MASGWESGGLGFKPHRLQGTFDPGLPKSDYQPKTVHLICKNFARRTLNIQKKILLD